MVKPTQKAPSINKKRMLYELYYGFRPSKPVFTPKDYPDLSGKTAIVTGSNTGIGLESVKQLYNKNCNVIMVVRTESKGNVARDTVLSEYPDSKGDLTVVAGCDYTDLNLIKDAAENVIKAIDNRPVSIIIHNAGLMASAKDLTSAQGYELMFQTNVLGSQLLQHFLDPLFLKPDSELKRIVWVSSGAQYVSMNAEYGIYWDNPTFENIPVKNRPSAGALYGQSKCGNVFQAHAWYLKNKKVVEDIGCISTSCYPGNLNTDLQRDWGCVQKMLFKNLFWDGKYGAYTELFCALNPKLTNNDQGAYVCPFGEIHDPREDLVEGMKNGTDLVFWDYIQNLIEPYF